MMIPETKTAPSTRDAWVLLIVSVELYLLSQVVLSKLSILWGTALGQLLCLALPSILYAKWKAPPVKKALRLRPVSRATWPRVILLAMTGIGPAILLDHLSQPLITRYFADWIPMLEALEELLTPQTTGNWVTNLIVIGLIAPVCEELLFRGAFQGTLEQRGPVGAITCTAVVFGIIHFNPFNFIGPIFFGVGIGLVVWRTGSILPAILWHMLNNSAAVLMMGVAGSDFLPPWWVSGVVTILFGLLLWEFIRHTRQSAPVLSPLAVAPAAKQGYVFRALKIVGATCAMLLLTSASCLGRITLGHDRFSPDYMADDVLFYTRDFLRSFMQIQTNDIVYWKDAQNQHTYFQRVVALEGENVTLGIKPREGAPFEVQIKRSEILGKVIWKLDPGEEVKKLMREIDTRHEKAHTEKAR